MKDTFTDPAQLQTFLNQLGAGSDQAFNELYATFRIPLYRYAFVQNLSDHDAQAVADDTLIEIAKNPLRFKGVDANGGGVAFNTYVFAIAKYKIMSQHRRHKTRRARELEDPDGEVGNAMVDDGLNVLGLLESAQDAEAVLHCIGKLPIEQSEAVQLVYWHEFTEQQVAQVQKIPAGTVKSRLSNAKKKLKVCFENWIKGGRYGR